MGRWAWSSDGIDFDNDGTPEIFVTTGMLTNASETDLESFFWRKVAAASPASEKTEPAYENGWNALSQAAHEQYSEAGQPAERLLRSPRRPLLRFLRRQRPRLRRRQPGLCGDRYRWRWQPGPAAEEQARPADSRVPEPVRSGKEIAGHSPARREVQPRRHRRARRGRWPSEVSAGGLGLSVATHQTTSFRIGRCGRGGVGTCLVAFRPAAGISRPARRIRVPDRGRFGARRKAHHSARAARSRRARFPPRTNRRLPIRGCSNRCRCRNRLRGRDSSTFRRHSPRIAPRCTRFSCATCSTCAPI